jgi:glycine oxidase
VVTHGAEVERIERAGDGVRLVGRDRDWEAGLLVMAAGSWSGHIPGFPTLPVHPVRGQMLMLGGIDWPWNGSLRGPHDYVVRRGATGLLVGATIEEAGFASYNTAGGVERLLRFALHALPGLENARLETTWAGLRPATPDGFPIVGPVPGWPVLAATGHYRNGILLAPWTAREITRMVMAGDFEEEGPFSPARFLQQDAADPLSPDTASV